MDRALELSNPFQPYQTKQALTMKIKLVIFDVDGTLIQAYSWQHIHQSLNTWNQAKKYRDQFFRNQITYKQWAQLDVALWKNQPLTKINQIISQMPYTEGAKETITTLKLNGIKIFLLSAGLTQVAERINKELGVDGFTANTLTAKDDLLTGKVKVNVSFHNKHKHLPTILRKFNLTSQQCAAVGDDPTLKPLFKKIHLAIAFNPTDKTVEEHAHVTVRSNNLQDILPHILEHHH